MKKDRNSMHLRVFQPLGLFIEREVRKITAEGHEGVFCILPRHVDYVTALVPGLLVIEDLDGEEEFCAVDGGTLVKCGPDVEIATRDAVRGPELGTLKETVKEDFLDRSERERKARTALTSLEASFIQRIAEVEQS